jgi:ribosomal protein S18 acetylase RimI-like enzyme
MTVVRDALPGDAVAVAALIRQFSGEDGYASPVTADEIRTLAFGAAPRIGILVAENAGEIAGYALFYPSYDTDHAARGLYLQDLYVRPASRRKGIGRSLMRHLARRTIDDGGLYMFWNALEWNRAGRAFYRRIGAREEQVVTLSLQPETLRALADGA